MDNTTVTAKGSFLFSASFLQDMHAVLRELHPIVTHGTHGDVRRLKAESFRQHFKPPVLLN